MKIALLLLPCLVMVGADLDHDGIDDDREQQLLDRFAPTFYIGAGECDGQPSSFMSGSPGVAEEAPGMIATPQAIAQDGTIYGQVSPHALGVEIHYYHLWRNDCGASPHPLDVEHVSTLIDGESDRALYWFAAAHQDTLCDSSHAARALDLGAQEHGAHVWISVGKHASHLDANGCTAGCGADRCPLPVALHRTSIVNLGEAGAPLNEASWIQSGAWPLASKMKSDFSPKLLKQLEGSQGVISLSTAPRGMRRTIAVSGATKFATTGALAAGARETGAAVKSGVTAAGRGLESAGHALGSAHKAGFGWLRAPFQR